MTELSEASVEESCSRLQNEPLFHLSLHSKELFHTNFLGRMCETYPTASAEAFGPWVPSRAATGVQVLRERNHLDLAVQIPGRAPFVVEAKVFSAPDEGQLDRSPMGGSDRAGGWNFSTSVSPVRTVGGVY